MNPISSVAEAWRLRVRRQSAEAQRICRAVLAEVPSHPGALHLLATIAFEEGPKHAAAEMLGVALESLRLQSDRDVSLEGSCLMLLAGVRQAEGQQAEAVSLLEEVLRLAAGSPPLLANAARGFAALGLMDDAAKCLESAANMCPADRDIWRDLITVHHARMDTLAAVEARKALVAAQPGDAAAHADLLISMHYTDGDGPETIFQEHLRWSRRHVPRLRKEHRHWPPDFFVSAEGSMPIRRPNDVSIGEIRPTFSSRKTGTRIGYLSPDWREYPAARFFAPLLSGHDRDQVEVVCYHDWGGRADTVTHALRSRATNVGAKWHEASSWTDEELARRISRDRIDVLVDLAGHMGGKRLGVLARSVAPVQVNYLSYPDTLGMSEVAYRITDNWHDPPGLTEHLHTESLIRIPGGCWAYQPDLGMARGLPDVSSLPARRNGFVTFGMMNRLVKVTPAMAGLWASILEDLPHARLSVLGMPGMRIEVVKRFFADHGIPAERLDVLAPGDRHHYLSQMRSIDIMLDPHPYAGMTTTCDSLWMGVPVVTLAGNTHVSRTGVSLLSAVSLQQLIAQSPEQYRAIARRLSQDINELEDLRSTLRQRLSISPLSNGPRLAREVELSLTGLPVY